MLLTEILRNKGADVVTVPPDADVKALLAVLAEHRIGAAVVSSDGRAVEGIVSERDVVRAIASRGGAVLDEPVGGICTTDVHTCTPDARVDDLMKIMTDRRIRHVPVVADGALAGIVSIGDVVKLRMQELESERAALSDYITTGG
ncbi:MAG TPA: CBS domain-containing protein [Mycobacteriales bacterium]|nr:CBS domain-containing protein [Mycobacteriales bacterium]